MSRSGGSGVNSAIGSAAELVHGCLSHEGRSTIGVRSSPSLSMRSVTSSPGSSQRPSVVLADLEQAAGAHRPAADQVAGSEPRVGRRAGQHLPEREWAADHVPRLISVPFTSAVMASS